MGETSSDKGRAAGDVRVTRGQRQTVVPSVWGAALSGCRREPKRQVTRDSYRTPMRPEAGLP